MRCLALAQDEAPDTWEVKDNVAENVLRDYEDRWWTACREARTSHLPTFVGTFLQVTWLRDVGFCCSVRSHPIVAASWLDADLATKLPLSVAADTPFTGLHTLDSASVMAPRASSDELPDPDLVLSRAMRSP